MSLEIPIELELINVELFNDQEYKAGNSSINMAQLI